MIAFDHHEASAPISLYVLRGSLVSIADVEPDDVVYALCTLRAENQIRPDDAVGIRDRENHLWIVNPFAKGSR